jgi:hypothetical protein
MVILVLPSDMAIILLYSSKLVTNLPFKAIRISPDKRPAFSAGELGIISSIMIFVMAEQEYWIYTDNESLIYKNEMKK